MSVRNLNAYTLPNISDEYKLVDNTQGKNLYVKVAAKEYDKSGFIPQEVGEVVQKLFNDDNYIIGIYRTKVYQVDDIFKNGIINNIDSQDSLPGPSIEKTIDFYRHHIYLLGDVKNSSRFNSDGAIVVKIPRYYMKNYTANKVLKPIFYKDDKENIRLLPEYVYGFIKTDALSNIVGIVKNSRYTDNHTYSDEGLICDVMDPNSRISSRRRV